MLSIIILAHNKVNLSRKCLQGIAESSTLPDCEILLVDNASEDETPRLAEEFKDKIMRLRYIRNDDNLSFSIANNRAAQQAKGKYLLLLNNDVVVGKSSVKIMVEALETDDSAGIAGAKLIYPDTLKVQHAGVAHMLWGYISNYGVGGNPKDFRLNDRKHVFAVTGAMLLIRRELFEQIGGFDEGYHWGYEDIDLCLKAHMQRKNVLYVPEAESLHYESATLKSKRDENVVDQNYKLFRKNWDHLLIERENRYMEELKVKGIHRVMIYGTGMAALGLFERLASSGFDVVGFTSSFEKSWGENIHGVPVYPLTEVGNMRYDKIIVGSQYYFEIERTTANEGFAPRLLSPVAWC